jgi:hypothetical protein
MPYSPVSGVDSQLLVAPEIATAGVVLAIRTARHLSVQRRFFLIEHFTGRLNFWGIANLLRLRRHPGRK